MEVTGKPTIDLPFIFIPVDNNEHPFVVDLQHVSVIVHQNENDVHLYAEGVLFKFETEGKAGNLVKLVTDAKKQIFRFKTEDIEKF